MQRHIHKLHGNDYEVLYTVTEGLPTFESVRLLDEDHEPVGPNLAGSFDHLFVLDETGTNGESVLSSIINSLVHMQ